MTVKGKEPNNPSSYHVESPVPIPSAEDAWRDMRKKLDEEMPEKRSPDDGKRWMLLILLLLLPLRMLWFMENGGRSVAALAGRNEGMVKDGKSVVTVNEKSGVPGNAKSILPANGKSAVPGDGKSVVPGREKLVMPGNGNKVDPVNKKTGTNSNVYAVVPANKQLSKSRGTAGRSSKLHTKEGKVRIDARDKEVQMKNETAKIAAQNKVQQTNEETVKMAEQNIDKSDMAKRRQPSGSEKNGREGEAMKKASIGTTLVQIAGVDRPPFLVAYGWTGKQTKALENPGKPSDVREKSEKSKGARPGKSSRILYAAGLQDGQGFPVGSQQQVNYSANWKRDLWLDYIPAPYFQFYPNRKMAIQAAIQFNNPQYTTPVHIYRKEGAALPGGLFRLDTIISVKKLYYFNIPLTIYYSPVTNLYLGTGLQFSNLRNGLALQDNVVHYIPGSGSNGPSSNPANNPGAGPQVDSVTGSALISLKENGPAYTNMRKVDWRALFEANYYWKRFTLGLQFQEALGEYLHTPVDGSSGKDRNSSFNFYLRYNIWERRSKSRPAVDNGIPAK